MSNLADFSWIGSQDDFVDRPDVFPIHHIVVGRFGGNSNAGQYKNEDGCLVWLNPDEDWEFAIILDAHKTAESAEAILKLFNDEKTAIADLLSLQFDKIFFKRLEEKVLRMFQSEEFLSVCRNVTGETACLIAVRKDQYLWWFSVGDCVLYLFHEELTSMGQYQVNQRHFYEWIGQVNTFERSVPCYSVGVKELRKGENQIFLTTDGLIECPNEPFVNPKAIYHSFLGSNDHDSVNSMLEVIKNNHVRDSTTIITWKLNILKDGDWASDQ
ncbi:protein phosphatase 2C domain-containing protein [Pseudoneobacillus sp. C159]